MMCVCHAVWLGICAMSILTLCNVSSQKFFYACRIIGTVSLHHFRSCLMALTLNQATGSVNIKTLETSQLIETKF